MASGMFLYEAAVLLLLLTIAIHCKPNLKVNFGIRFLQSNLEIGIKFVQSNFEGQRY
jgi:hypothetical protein